MSVELVSRSRKPTRQRAGEGWLRDLIGGGDMFRAARKGNRARVAALLARGVTPDVRDGRDATPLHYAATSAEGIVEVLLWAGADANVADRLGRTPLHAAVLGRASPSVVERLLVAGADPNAVDSSGATPAMEAVALVGASTREDASSAALGPDVARLLEQCGAGGATESADRGCVEPDPDSAPHDTSARTPEPRPGNDTQELPPTRPRSTPGPEVSTGRIGPRVARAPEEAEVASELDAVAADLNGPPPAWLTAGLVTGLILLMLSLCVHLALWGNLGSDLNRRLAPVTPALCVFLASTMVLGVVVRASRYPFAVLRVKRFRRLHAIPRVELAAMGLQHYGPSPPAEERSFLKAIVGRTALEAAMRRGEEALGRVRADAWRTLRLAREAYIQWIATWLDWAKAHARTVFELEGARFQLCTDGTEFLGLARGTGQAALLLPFADYSKAQLQTDAQGLSAPPRLFCARCLAELPLPSQTLPSGSTGKALTARMPVACDARTACDPRPEQTDRCPMDGCGSGSGILVWDHPECGTVDGADLAALRALWRRRGEILVPPAASGGQSCDLCGSPIGVVRYAQVDQLLCRECAHASTAPSRLPRLRENPDCFGLSELWRARAFVSGDWDVRTPPRMGRGGGIGAQRCASCGCAVNGLPAVPGRLASVTPAQLATQIAREEPAFRCRACQGVTCYGCASGSGDGEKWRRPVCRTCEDGGDVVVLFG